MADSNALLPTGMMDQMPDAAEREAAICHKLQSVFAQFGYRLVNPPLLEFEETLLAEGAGQALSTNTFRLMDPVSRRMMALRSDTTAQIARLVASRFNKAPRPVRLSYVADVLRINATQLRPERQFKQAGCEFIGKGQDAATEIALLSLIALNESGVKNITIDFTAPEIIKNIVSGKNKEEVLAACQRRDRETFLKLGATGKILAVLDDLSGPVEGFFAAKKKIKTIIPVKKILDEIEKTIRDLQKALKIYGLEKSISITVDLLETRGFEYQSFPCFTLFAKNTRGELGRGGNYNSRFAGHNENACGFTLYMDSVMRAVPKQSEIKAIKVSENTSWTEIKNLQSKGWNIVRSSANSDAGATHILKNGKVEKI